MRCSEATKPWVAAPTALHEPKVSKPCHSISFLGTLYPPNIRRATCTALVSFRVVSPAPQLSTPLHMASSLGARTPPVYQPGHGDSTSRLHRGHAPLWSHPSAWAGTGHVVTTSSCFSETACPPGSRNGPGLAATHPHRIWSLSPSGSLGGPVTVRALLGSSRLGFPKSFLSLPQLR